MPLATAGLIPRPAHSLCARVSPVGGRLVPTDPLVSFGSSGFRTRWLDLLSALGVPLARAPAGFDLSPALRFRTDISDGINRVFWHDRWRQASSTERYLHDAAASAVLPSLAEAARDRVSYLADASALLVDLHRPRDVHCLSRDRRVRSPARARRPQWRREAAR